MVYGTNKDFLEIAKDSEDLVPKKLLWAKKWEMKHAGDRFWLDMLTFHLLISAVLNLIASLSFLIALITSTFLLVLGIVYGFGWYQARQSHELTKITVKQIEDEVTE